MSRRTRSQWFSPASSRRRLRSDQSHSTRPGARPLRFERLEDRTLLAVFTVTNINDSGAGSLRQAILNANAAIGADQINFAAALSGQTIALNPGTALPTLTGQVAITGVSNLTVQASVSHVVDVAAGAIAEITGLTLRGSQRVGNGGVIANSGQLILANVSIQNGSVIGAHGAGIYNAVGADLRLYHSTISNNIALNGNGGGVYNLGNLEVYESTISTNSVFGGGQGGGIHNTGRAIVHDSTIAENQAIGSTATAQGGGIYNNSPFEGISLQRVTLQGNRALGANGSVGANGSTGTAGIISPPFVNVAAGPGGPGGPGGTGRDAQGGGLYSFVGYVHLIDSTIDSNIAQGGNGGNGGTGGNGGPGAAGTTGFFEFTGGRGGNGGDGGDGGTGGSALGGGLVVVNITSNSFTWRDSTLTGNEARGGEGGRGGTGGNGAAGGNGANGTPGGPFEIANPPTAAGDGGSAGLGGLSGVGGAAEGGGLVYAAEGSRTLNLNDATIAGNRAIAGAGGVGGATGNGGNGGAGGNGVPAYPNGAAGGDGGHTGLGRRGGAGGSAEGGGIRHRGGGVLNLFNTTISSNETTGGRGGSGGAHGAQTGQGGAGGLAASGGNNGANGANGSPPPTSLPASGAGGHASGGGIFVSDATTTLRNATVASNLVTGGNAAAANLGANGGNAEGGGLYVSSNAMATLSHVTLSLNHVHSGTGIGVSGLPGSIGGGGVWTADSAHAATLTHTIVAGNLGTVPGSATSPSDLSGKPVADGSAYNLIGTGGNGGLAGGANGNLVGIANPMLGPLADNGGTTLTMAPLVDSPAIDAGDPLFDPVAAELPLDQRGKPRVQQGKADSPGPRIDIGAVEATKWFVATGGEFFFNGSQPSLRFTLSDLVAGASVSPSDVVVEQAIPIAIPSVFVPAIGASVDGATITFTLPADTPYFTYQVTLPAGSVTDTAGNPLLIDRTFTFTHTPALPGDYNLNGEVDAADYVLWRKTLGTTGVPHYSGADGSGNGTVGPEDYGVWAANFGNTLPSEGSGATAASAHGDPVALADTVDYRLAETVSSLNVDNGFELPVADALTVEDRNEALDERVWSGIALAPRSLRTTPSNPLVASSRPSYATPSDRHDGALLSWLAAWDGPTRRLVGLTETTADWHDEQPAETPVGESDAFNVWNEPLGGPAGDRLGVRGE